MEGKREMKIHVVDTDTGFGELEGTWNRLSEEMPPAIFSSFDYVRTAWSHYHNAIDRLFLLVLTDDSVVRGIAPFYVARRWRRRIPHRVIQFIAAWEGDRHRLVTAEIIRENFGGTYRELDLLGTKEEGEPPRHKADWATGRRETVHWTGYRVSGRLLPVVVPKRLKSLLARLVGHA